MNVALWCVALATTVSVSLCGSSNKGQPLKDTWPWYHSADEIQRSLQQLVGQCKGAEADLSQRTDFNTAGAAGEVVALDVLHIGRSGPQQKKKAMLVFGEHAREVISPESAVHFAQALCGLGPDAERVDKVLDRVSFTMVPNANPLGRKQVEDGHYCKRTNEDGVDINRNFGDGHRASEKPGDEQNPGPGGFSEPESKILKGLIDQERPDIYVSVHSGAYLLGTPFGYTRDVTPDNEADMLEVLKPISQKYCDGNCPFGDLAKLINYENPGCDIDYVAEQVGSPYVFTWEIYVGQRFREAYIREAQMQRTPEYLMSFMQNKGRASMLRGRSRSEESAVTAAWRKMQEPEDDELILNCMDQFNPQTREETESVVATWTGAYLELCEEVVRKMDSASTSVVESASSLSIASD